MSELIKLTLLEAKDKLNRKEITSVELTEAFINEITKRKDLNAFITTTFDLALEQAKRSDKNILANKTGKLEGIPLALKDNFCTMNVRTTAASKILENFIPSYESTFGQKLLAENYVLLGKTNLDSFACGSTTATSYFGPTINPIKSNNDDRDLIPGGSSGGSAAAVSANLCIAASGTDTGGSIRQPASLCNLVGIKPTYGRVSRSGIIAYGSSLDQAGWLAKTVEDAAYLTDIVCGKDKQDSTTVDAGLTNFFSQLNRKNIQGKKIGIIKEFLNLEDKIEKDILNRFYEIIEFLKKEGCEIVEVSIPTIAYVPELYMILSYNELASNLSRYDGVRFGHRTKEQVNSLEELYCKSRAEGFCANVKKRILLGYYFSSEDKYEKYLLKAMKVRRMLVNEFMSALKNVDIIMTPTTPQTAFPINLTAEERLKNQESNYLNDLFVCPANMAGLPGISIPVGNDSKGLPMGMHFMSNLFEEQLLFDMGLLLEKSL